MMGQYDKVPGGFRGSTKSFFCQCQLRNQIPLNQVDVADHLHQVHNFSKERSMSDAREIVVKERLRLKAGGLKG